MTDVREVYVGVMSVVVLGGKAKVVNERKQRKDRRTEFMEEK